MHSLHLHSVESYIFTYVLQCSIITQCSLVDSSNLVINSKLTAVLSLLTNVVTYVQTTNVRYDKNKMHNA